MIPLFFVPKQLVPHLHDYIQPSRLFEIPKAAGDKPMGKLAGVTWFSNRVEGPPGMVHGGASATCLDQLLGLLVNQIHLPKNSTNFTRTLKLDLTYKGGVPLNSIVRFVAWVTRVDGRKHWCTGRLIDEDAVTRDGLEGPLEELPFLVQAEGLFVQPRLSADQGVETGPNREEIAKL